MLDLPDPDRSQLGKSPLDLVVCQIRFDRRAIISASNKVGFDFQAALQASEGTRWKMEPIEGPPPVTIVVTTDGPHQISGGDPTNGWRFTSGDGAYVVVLMSDSIAIETRRYTRWSEFRATVERAIERVATSFSPEIELRVGLRYVDRLQSVDAGQPADWTAHLQPALHGLVGHEVLGVAVLSQQQQIMLDLGAGVGVCRFAHGTLPTDQGLEYVLDYDLYRQDARPFERTEILAALDAFNTEALKLFQASITPVAAEALR